MADAMQKLVWVFGYGSLMWDPGFQPTETVRARLDGYARRFCLRSVRHRGTAESPGLVLGLDPDGTAHCRGLALRIDPFQYDEVMAYLRAREMGTEAYREAIVTLALEDGRRVEALAYVMRCDHPQYAGDLCSDEQARIIAGAHGGRGPNADYLFNTASHLAQIGLPDSALDHLAERVRRMIEASDSRQDD